MAGIFYSLASAPVVTVVAYRMLLAALFMLPVALVARGGGASQTRAVFSRADLWATAGAGLLFGSISSSGRSACSSPVSRAPRCS